MQDPDLTKMIADLTTTNVQYGLAGFIGGLLSGMIKHKVIRRALTSGFVGAIFAVFMSDVIADILGIKPSAGIGFAIGFSGYTVAKVFHAVDWAALITNFKRK